MAQIDYDLHGLLGVRLVNASPANAATASRQLGPPQGSLSREPDITIRFVDQLPVSSSVRYLGLDDVGYTDDEFLIMHGRQKHREMTQLAFADVGEQCTILCEKGLSGAISLLTPLVNLTMLSKGLVPIHAAAFVYNGKGILTTGWSKSGKTETLLAFMAQGAEYVGDEWIYLSADGRRMHGTLRPVTLWEWHLQELGEYWDSIARNERMRLRTLRLAIQSMDWATQWDVGRGSYLMGAMQRVNADLKRRMSTKLSPYEIFGNQVGSLAGPVDKLFYVASHDSSEVAVQPMEPQEIAQRMAYSMQHQRQYLMSYYLKFKFAFPDLTSDLIENALDLERTALTEALSGKEAYGVFHPYPVSFQALFDAIHPFCE
jgi:hypothetical protein